MLGFGSSESLAGAYGVAITTALAFFVVRRRSQWIIIATATVLGSLFLVDMAFFRANLPKIPHGGWIPLLVAGIVFVLMST